MHTEYFIVDKDQPDKQTMQRAAELLKQGKLVAFPTETVYGLGANGLDSQAVSNIYQAKGRPSDNPLILHIANQQELIPLVTEIPANAQVLMDKYWPGPLTVVFKRTNIVPDIVSGGLGTVAVRLPASTVACELIALAGIPIAAPSANTSGRPSPTSAQAVLADLDGRIDAIIDAGICDIGVESTVVDCTTPVPTLLRPGGITLEMLMDTLGEVEIDPALNGGTQCIPRSPGMKYTHYAPAAPMILFEGTYPHIADLILKEIETALAAGQKVGVIVSEETAERLPATVVSAVYGLRQHTEEIAANLYTALRSFDDSPVDIIYAEGIPEEGLGLAVMNRLRKASGYKIIKE
ncbi:MAG: Sua5/YciO/YrdC/YwlC family protein [Firmicutes bacterium]|nr:Sua5/YciO/YrdC/YwlC family protein [Bacillota bacterium]